MPGPLLELGLQPAHRIPLRSRVAQQVAGNPMQVRLTGRSREFVARRACRADRGKSQANQCVLKDASLCIRHPALARDLHGCRAACMVPGLAYPRSRFGDGVPEQPCTEQFQRVVVKVRVQEVNRGRLAGADSGQTQKGQLGSNCACAVTQTAPNLQSNHG